MSRQGWRSACLARIGSLAGVPAESGVSYHFGSREGLLHEIVAREVFALEPVRKQAMEELTTTSTLADHVTAMGRPFLDCVQDPGTRDYVRLVGQLTGFVGPAGDADMGLTCGTVLEKQHRGLVELVARLIGADRAEGRVRNVQMFLMAAGSARAVELSRWIERTGEQDPAAAAAVMGRPDHEEFVVDLVAQLAAAAAA